MLIFIMMIGVSFWVVGLLLRLPLWLKWAVPIIIIFIAFDIVFHQRDAGAGIAFFIGAAIRYYSHLANPNEVQTPLGSGWFARSVGNFGVLIGGYKLGQFLRHRGDN